ncbi:MAG: hypothetical protein SNJ52_05575 [Verrucomicrobiia bacterium]
MDRFDLLAGVVLLVGTFVLLVPSLSFEALSYDDPVYLHGEGHVKRGLSWEGFRWALQERHFVIPVPLTWLSLMATTSIFGEEPWGYRLVNILLHAANALLVFALMRRLCPRSQLIPLLVALVFAWHPTRLESVIWISERKDVLSIFFLLVTLHGYLSYSARRSVWRYGFCVLLPFVLSVASKPSTVVIPALLVLLDFAPLRRIAPEVGARRIQWKDLGRLFADILRILPDKIPLLAVAFTLAALTWSSATDQGAIVSWERFTFWERLASLPYVYGIYLWRLFVPLELGLFIPHPFGWPPGLITAGCALIFAGLIFWAVAMLWRERLILVGLLWFAILLLPVSGLFQNGEQLVAFRYTYLAYVGLILALALTIGRVWTAVVGLGERRAGMTFRTRLFAVAVVGGAMAVATLNVLPHWRNSRAIWDYTLLVTRRNPVALSLQASAAEASGLVREQWAKARRAFELDRSKFEAFLRMADGYLKLGEIGEAERAYSFAEPILIQWLERNGYDTSDFAVDQARLKMVNLPPARLADRAGFAKALLARATAAALVGTGELAEKYLRAAIWTDPPVVWSPYGLLMAGQLKKLGRDEAAKHLVAMLVMLSRYKELPNIRRELDALRLRAPSLREVPLGGIDLMRQEDGATGLELGESDSPAKEDSHQ